MREIQKKQRLLGQVNIADIQFNPKSRDDIPQLLRGIQFLYVNDDTREALFSALKKMIPSEVDKNNGRPGMELWKIFVMGVLRLNLNWDYDRLHEMVNHHDTIREMLGHSWEDDKFKYQYQTIKDNVALFTEEILDEINQIVVNAGHKVLKKKEKVKILKGRCDSTVVKTNVHYPTDCNLLFDAMRKLLTLIFYATSICLMSDWRQYKHHILKLKKLCRKTAKRKTSSKKEALKAEDEERRLQAVREYLKTATNLLGKAKKTIEYLKKYQLVGVEQIEEIEMYFQDALRQINQIERRVLKGEKIPHQEKVFSLFERHTEWIVRGKAGVDFELGLRICILEDQDGFILHHKIMEQITDEEIALEMVEKTQKKFPQLKECSFDKGFYSKENKSALEDILDLVVLPKCGKLNQVEKEFENSEEFVEGRRRHSSVESGINALQEHGLEKCRDKGIKNFKCYVALSVVARNIQKLGALLQKQEKKRMKQCRLLNVLTN